MCKVVDQNADHTDALQNIYSVLVNFSATTQSIERDNHRTDDFGSCLLVLMEENVGLDPGVVWRSFGEKESWDFIGY